MTRYFVDVSTELLEQNGALWPDSFRLVERWGPRGKIIERWIVEDDEAPEDLRDHLIEPSFTRRAGSDKPEISDRFVRELTGLD